MSYLISLNFQLFENIAYDGSFKHFVILIVFVIVFVLVFVCVIFMRTSNSSGDKTRRRVNMKQSAFGRLEGRVVHLLRREKAQRVRMKLCSFDGE